MRQAPRRGQRTRSALLLLTGVVGCDSVQPAAPEQRAAQPAKITAQPVSTAPAESPAPTAATETQAPPPAIAAPPEPPVLSAESLRDGGRLVPITPQPAVRLPAVGPADQPANIVWPQKPIAYPTTATP